LWPKIVKARQGKKVINKAFYLALGVNMEGHKELLGLWLSENEGATFWLGVLTELQKRGVQEILIACVDGLRYSIGTVGRHRRIDRSNHVVRP